MSKIGIDLYSDTDWKLWETLGEEIAAQFGAL